jgi:subtilase family protein
MADSPHPRDTRLFLDVPGSDDKSPDLRRIADPRFAWLLSIDDRELARVWNDERSRLRRLSSRAAVVREGYRWGRFTPQEAAAHLDDLARRVPSLLTAGVRRSSKGGFQFSVVALTTAGPGELDKLGVKVKANGIVRGGSDAKRSPRIVTALADAGALARAAQSGLLQALELGRSWRPHLDTAVPTAELNSLFSGTALVAGQGVIIGVIDLAVLDFYHPDFLRPDGSTRVRFLWDQELDCRTGEQRPPADGTLPNFMLPGAQSYGVEYTAADIDAELAQYQAGTAYTRVRHAPPSPPFSSNDGHGTAVTGCAAGNGAAKAGEYCGGAPQADIMYVRVAALDPLRATGDHTQILEAFAYVFARADLLGQPCVVNMSLGDLQGPHDGTSLGERFLDNLLIVPGRAITLSAGNWNGDWRHAAGATVPGQDTNVRFEFGGAARTNDAIDLWYPGPDRLDASLLIPGAGVAVGGAVLGPVLPGQLQELTLSPTGVKIALNSTLGAPGASGDGDNHIAITFFVPSGQRLPRGTLTLRLHGSSITTGGFQAWLDRNNPAANFLLPFRREHETTLGVPATARGPITVGAHGKQDSPKVTGFSGRGPTRDLRMKPDILATGRSITAPAIRHRDLSPANALEYVSGRNGTSYAAPLAAAACALLFECLGPTATCADLKSVLQSRGETLASEQPGAPEPRVLKVGHLCP